MLHDRVVELESVVARQRAELEEMSRLHMPTAATATAKSLLYIADPCATATAAYVRLHVAPKGLDRLWSLLADEGSHVALYTRVESDTASMQSIYKVADRLPESDCVTVQLLIQFDRTLVVSAFCANVLCKCPGLAEHLIPLETNCGCSGANANAKAVLAQPIPGALVTEQGYTDKLFVYYHYQLLGKVPAATAAAAAAAAGSPPLYHLLMTMDPETVLPWYEVSKDEHGVRHALPFIRLPMHVGTQHVPTFLPVVPKQAGTLEPLSCR